MRLVRGIGVALVVAVAFGVPASAQQARQQSNNPILYDASGRQLPDPRDRPVSQSSKRDFSAPQPKFGRVAVDRDLTVGLETEKKLKTDHFPDGTRIPGVETQRKDGISPFMGFSLSVPTNSLGR